MLHAQIVILKVQFVRHAIQIIYYMVMKHAHLLTFVKLDTLLIQQLTRALPVNFLVQLVNHHRLHVLVV